MARRKITAYVTHDTADMLHRLAAIDDRSMSDIVADAITRRLSGVDRSAGQAAILASLSDLSLRLRAIEEMVGHVLHPRAGTDVSQEHAR